MNKLKTEVFQEAAEGQKLKAKYTDCAEPCLLNPRENAAEGAS